MDLVRLAPATVATEHLIPLMTRLATFHFFAEAEAALDELERRPEDERTWDVDGHRVDLFHLALDAEELACAERLRARLPEEELEALDLLKFDLLTGDRGLLARLDAVADEALRNDCSSKLYGIGFDLLQHSPALGLLVARGLIDGPSPLDSITLLEAMDEARDRLLLPPDDSAWDLFDHLEETRLGARQEQAAKHANQRLAEEVEELRAQVAAEATKARSVQARLREQEAALGKARAELEAQVRSGEEPAPQAEPADPAQVERLRGKVADLNPSSKRAPKSVATSDGSSRKRRRASPRTARLRPRPKRPSRTPSPRRPPSCILSACPSGTSGSRTPWPLSLRGSPRRP